MGVVCFTMVSAFSLTSGSWISSGRVQPRMISATSEKSMVDRVPRSLNKRQSSGKGRAIGVSPSQDTGPSVVGRITTEAAYYQMLESNPDTLVVVKFFAPWCRSCKAMDVKYQRLAKETPGVKFFEVDVVEGIDLKKALGVRVVPSVKLYAGSTLGQVASFSCGPRKFPELVRKLGLCKDVPTLVSKVTAGTSTGMMEMHEAKFISNLKAQVDDEELAPTTSNRLDTSKESEPKGLVMGLMEKLARQEKMARALGDGQLGDLSFL
ncbi:unnamed protein product [Choristocarpus tenellus]